MQGTLRGKPALAGRPLWGNSLVADFFEVAVENTSGRDFAVFINDKLFWVRAGVREVTGWPLPFKEFKSVTSIKRMGLIPGDPAVRTEVLRPGQVVRLPLNMPFSWGGAAPRAGRYRVWAICEYYRGSDGAGCTVESPPLPVTVTAAHVRDWKQIWE